MLRHFPPYERQGRAADALRLILPGLPMAELRKLVQLAVRYAESPDLFA